jgi:hypothetical protein
VGVHVPPRDPATVGRVPSEAMLAVAPETVQSTLPGPEAVPVVTSTLLLKSVSITFGDKP